MNQLDYAKDSCQKKTNQNMNRLQWFQEFLLKYFEEKDDKAFVRMVRRNEEEIKDKIIDFCNKAITDHDWKKMILVFYKTEYEKTYYKLVYTKKKITRPLLPPPSPRPESPLTPVKKVKGKTSTKQPSTQKKFSDIEIVHQDRDFVDNCGEIELEREGNARLYLEKGKRKKSFDNKTRSQSPKTVIELGPQSESEHVYQKVMKLVKKKNKVKQFHCCSKPFLNTRYKNQIENYVCIIRKTTKGIPQFDTHDEVISEFPKYIIISLINTQDHPRSFLKNSKVLLENIDATFKEPTIEKEELESKSERDWERLYKQEHKLNLLSFPYEAFHLGASDFYHGYHKALRKFHDEFGGSKKNSCLKQNEITCQTEKGFTLKNVLYSPLYTMPEDLANLFYTIRQMSEIKDIEFEEKPNLSPLKDNIKSQLQELLNKMNWCINHLESDLDIEIYPTLEADDLSKLQKDETIINKAIKDKIEKKLDIWGRYISSVLTRCRAKKSKGFGPYAEYEYWFKREDQLGPLLLTLYGKSVSKLVFLLNKTDSPEVNRFISKRLALKKYYETSKANKEYISVSMHSLEKIITANDMEEIKLLIPDFWKNLRYLWILSGYWGVKTNIIRFIERVQYLIVKKCVKVLEVNNFFTIPPIIAKQLALDVIEVMKLWKKSFYVTKASIEMHQWEMRWEFPLHRIFNVTDYIGKLSKDFCYLAEVLKHYLNIFSNEFAKVVQEEVVVDCFVQRVKLLTMPLKTADFNIYDPENDVHWNLLMETFMRDLNLIEKESIHIINQSFKNLRSSVNATNLLLKYKENGINEEDKYYVLLMSKFDFIILQIIKEIKLISQLIMNSLPRPASYSVFHSEHSATIYWIRKLSIYLQFRFVYLSHIREIQESKTFYRAVDYFNKFSSFYEICQLIYYVDWINTEEHFITSQLVKKVFKLKQLESSISSEEGNINVTVNDCILDSQQSLLIEGGLLIEIDFDFRLWDIIVEINDITKLGFILPKKFYSLALLKESLLKNFRILNFTLAKYNSLMLNLQKEELLSLKTFIYQSEHILIKGLKYYCWYTIKAENFCEELNTNFDMIYSFKEDVHNTVHGIQNVLLKMELVDWFDFTEQVDQSNFQTIKEFFEELEQRRNDASKEMCALFAMITPLLWKMESLILNRRTGKNQYLALFYKYFEEKILTALIRNLLQNIKKFKKFLFGNEGRKFQLTLSIIPDVGFDFHKDQWHYYLTNSVDKLLLRYKMIPRWQLGSCLEVIHSYKNKNILLKYNYLEDIIQFKIVAAELIEVRQTICMVTTIFSEYLFRWKQFESLWVYDKESSIENFISQPRKLIEYCDFSLVYYDQFIRKLNSCRDYVDLYCARIQIKLAKTEILYHALEWKYILKSKLTGYAKSHIIKIHQRLSVIYCVLTQSIYDLGEFQDVLQVINDIIDSGCDYDTSVSHINKIRYILVRHGLKFSQEDYKVLNEVRYMGCIVNKVAKYRLFLISPAKKLYTQISQDLISNFASQCRRFAEIYFNEGPGTIGDNLSFGMRLMQKYKSEFQIYNAKKDIMIQAEQLFELSSVSYNFYEEAFQEFLSLEVVYKLYETQKEIRDDWASISWINMDSKMLTDGIDVFLFQYNQLPDKIKNLPVSKEINKNMEYFKSSVPLMVELKNDAIKKRHWEELMAETGHVFETSPSKFTLNDLFLMNLHLHKEAVTDIIGKAVRESGVEQSIIAVIKYWNRQKFTFSLINKQYILTGIETIIQSLENYCIDLQKMSDSQFAIPFNNEIRSWEEKLSGVYEFLTNWIMLQNDLLNVKHIFQKIQVQKQLSDVHKQFDLINKQFSKIIKIYMAKPGIIDQCLSHRHLKEIIMLSTSVEKCKGLLMDYVNSEKNNFPRFHLLSDNEVFSILSATELENIHGVLSKIFHNVSSLSTSFLETKEHQKSVTGMVSKQGETISFKSPVPINKSIPLCMRSVTAEMKKTIKYRIKMTIYNYATIKQSWSDWIMSHASVCILGAYKIWWTAEVEYMFIQMKEGDLKAMKKYMYKLNNRQDELFLKIRTPLESLDRIKYINIFLLSFHGKSVVDKLINESVIGKDEFEWESQLRFYWMKTPGALKIKQCSGEFEYGYEYMGLANRLVITPLTERVMFGLTQAFFHHFAAAVTGSTSTGKTATINEMSEIFGILCIFINCSSLLDKKTFKNMFAALWHEGLWGCFDDFNKLDISAISMIEIQLSAMRLASICNDKSVTVDGFDINFENTTKIIITSSMTFSNSKDFPESIKLLFRPITCVLPNVEDICQAILLSEGFSNAKVLSKKITSLYEMANDILFRIHQSDFGLRNLKSLLITCGNLRRNAPDVQENIVIIKALRDINRSQLSFADDELFMGLIKDIFPNIECPVSIHPKLEKAIATVWGHMGYVSIPYMMEKVIQTHVITKMRQLSVLVGPTGGGKTFIINTLCSTLSSMGNQSKVIKIIPQAYSATELYGYFSGETTKWFDGLFTKIFRELNSNIEKNVSNYILLDGEIEDIWFESLNLLMDDHKIFTLASSERISLAENCFLLFEAGSLHNTAPGFVSRVGVVYVDCQYLGYRPYWKRWTESRINEKERDLFNKYFEKYLPSCLSLISNGIDKYNSNKPLKTVISQTSLNLVIQLCFILDALMPVVENEIKSSSNDAETYENEIESVFIQAIYLSLGANLSTKSKECFDEFIKGIINFKLVKDNKENRATYGTLPSTKTTLFEYHLDRNLKNWVPWEDCIHPYIHDKCLNFDEIIIPTEDLIKVIWILKLINHHNVRKTTYKSLKYKTKFHKKKTRPILLIGESCTSKTTLLKEFSRQLNLNDYDQLHFDFSTSTSAPQIQAALESRLEEYTPFVWRPKRNKKLIVFIDDLNKPKNGRNSMEKPNSFLKMILENNGVYTRNTNFVWKRLKHIYFYSTMNISSTNTYEDQRFLSLFSIYYIHSPSNEVIKHIFTSIIESHLNSFEENVRKIVPNLVLMTIKIYEFTLSNLLPTPSKFHYIYNLRDLSRITQGLLQISPHLFKRSEQVIRVWRNEVTRVLWDRLVCKDEQSMVQRQMKTVLETFYPDSINHVMEDPLLFGDYRNAMHPCEPRDYEDLIDYEAVYHLFTEILQDLNYSYFKPEIVLFESALDHLTRIHRILRIYRGHAVIIGPVGSGKKTVVRLAAYTAGCKVTELPIRKDYHEAELIRDIKKLFFSVMMRDQKTALMVTSHQLTREGFLEIISNMMSSDKPLSIYNIKERSAIINEIKKHESTHSDFSSRHQIWKQLQTKCKELFHTLLLMTSSEDILRTKSYLFSGLINNATVDWMNSWPSEALYTVGRRFMKEVDILPEKIKESVVETIVYIHEITGKYLQKMEGLRFQAFITPNHYLDTIKLYIKLVNNKNSHNTYKSQIFESAIKKVNEAIKDLKILTSKINSQKLEVDQKESVYKTLSSEMSKVSNEITTKKNLLGEKSKEIDFFNKEFILQMEEIHITLEKAMGRIHNAIDSIKMIDSEYLREISVQESHPEIAFIIFECVLIFKGQSELNWNAVKKFLSIGNITSVLEEINVNSITIDQQKQVRGRLKRVTKMINTSAVSDAELKFLHFVKVLLGYCNVLREIKPKQDRATDLKTEMNQAQNSLNSLQIEIERLETEVNSIYESNEAAKADELKARCEQDVNFTKLEAANRLINGLTLEHSRWINELNTIQQEKLEIFGNALMSASFLVYIGIFNYEARIELLQVWCDFMKKKKILISLKFKIENELADINMLNKWIAEGLSNNEWSIQNAILFTYSTRVPLCIDPKQQALKMIMKIQDAHIVKVISYEDTNFQEEFEDGIKLNHSILIKDVDYIDSLTFNIIEGGHSKLINDSCQEDIISGTKRCYMTTRNNKPNFDPVVYSHANVIDLSINIMELEDRLLDFIFEYEENELWNKQRKVTIHYFTTKECLTKLEQNLVLKVGKTDCGLLENIEKIEKLCEMKMKIEEVKAEYNAAEATIAENNKLRDTYKPVAKCCTVLYFVLSEMGIVNCMYEISDELYFDMLSYSLKDLTPKILKDLTLEERIEGIQTYLKKFFYNFHCRGMFAHHQSLLSLKMAMAFDKCYGVITQNEINFFVREIKEVNESGQSPVTWISNEGWQQLQILSSEFPNDFGVIINHIVSNRDEWQKWFDVNQSGITNFPHPYNNIRHFKKLMLLKCLHVSSIYNYVSTYISEVMGEEFNERSLTMLDEVFNQSSCKIPVILISTPGVNPYADITKLALKHNNSLLAVSLGSGVKEICKSKLLEAVSEGFWITYKNCHLETSFILEIYKVLQMVPEKHERFRLWLVTEFSNKFPSRVVKSSIKVMTDSPNGLKAKLRDIYTQTGAEYLTSCNHPAFKSLLHISTFFHCIIQERKKYGAIGWNAIYDFGASDYHIAIKTIQLCLKRDIEQKIENIPWKTLKYVIGEIIYGGHMMDKFDRGIISCYLQEYFGDFLYSNSKPFTFYKDQNILCTLIPDGNIYNYLDEIEKLPSQNISNIVGLHPNADLWYNQQAVKMYQHFLVAECHTDTDSYICKEKAVMNTSRKILQRLPSTFNMMEIKNICDVSTPTTVVLIQELITINILIQVIFNSSTNLTNAIAGKIEMDEDTYNMYMSLLENKLPIKWRLVTPETQKTLPRWMDFLLQRVEQYEKWISLGHILPVMWLSGLHKPRSFLMALIQEASRKMEKPLENLILQTNIINVYDSDKIHDPAEMGCYVKGLFLEGAGWNSQKNCLRNLKPNSLFEPLPVMLILPTEKFRCRRQNRMKIPVYTTAFRNFSRSGLIFEAELKSSSHIGHYILQGVCILLNND